jgi:UDP-glucose 4-epimerase
MRVLVTGATGFIGSHVVDKLCDHGVDVRAFDLAPPDHRDDVDFFPGSILELEQLVIALRGVDAVVHLAAIANVNDFFEHPSHSEMVGSRGTANVLEAMRRVGLKRIVFASTVWVYAGAVEDEVDEDTPLLAPPHLYSATKLAGEYYCHAYAQLYGLEPTILRFGIPFGPRARGNLVIPIFVRKVLDGETITIDGDGSQFRKFVYVEDLAKGVVAGLRPAAINRTYNLDGKRKTTIKEIAETIQKLLGEGDIQYKEARPGDYAGKEVSSQRAFHELGWEANTPFEEGVRRYIDWHKAQVEKDEARWNKVDSSLIQ